MPVFVYSSVYEADIGPHVFPVQKYRRTKELLVASGRVRPGAFVSPRAYGREVLRLVHDREYLDDFFGLRRTPATLSSELPLDAPIASWFATAADGTLTAAAEAVESGAAFHIGGGFHHAFPGHAEGFCYLNDVAVAARYALEAGWAAQVSIVDLDVHQGNGTARIFAGENRVYTFSMHQQNNYPAFKETGDLDFGLPDGLEDAGYLSRLDDGLARSVDAVNPNLVFYVAGADPYRDDQLGGLALTMEGLAERDRRVYAAAKKAGAAVVVCLAGGYAVDPDDTARIHAGAALGLLDAWPDPKDAE